MVWRARGANQATFEVELFSSTPIATGGVVGREAMRTESIWMVAQTGWYCSPRRISIESARTHHFIYPLLASAWSWLLSVLLVLLLPLF